MPHKRTTAGLVGWVGGPGVLLCDAVVVLGTFNVLRICIVAFSVELSIS